MALDCPCPKCNPRSDATEEELAFEPCLNAINDAQIQAMRSQMGPSPSSFLMPILLIILVIIGAASFGIG